MKITAKSKLHGVELGEELASAMSQALEDQIDWGILCDLMTQLGWHKVEASTRYSTDDYSAVKEWLANNIKGHYKSRFDTWLFERSEDAVWFSLRWS